MPEAVVLFVVLLFLCVLAALVLGWAWGTRPRYGALESAVKKLQERFEELAKAEEDGDDADWWKRGKVEEDLDAE